jgi:hypothetical protein
MEGTLLSSENKVVEKKRNKTVFDKIIEQTRDTTLGTKGLKLSICYDDHWVEMKHIVKGHNLEMQDHSPILVLNELKNLRQINTILEQINGIPEIKDYAKNGVDSSDIKTFEKETEKRIFITISRIYPEFCRQNSLNAFLLFMKNPKNLSVIREMFSVHGIVLDTESDIDNIVRKILNK